MNILRIVKFTRSHVVLLTFMVISMTYQLHAAEPVRFNRDIRPILAAKCFACHGRDEQHREADLRLDVREVATESRAIVPGKAEESELVRRVFSDDPDERMPPPDSNDTLNDDQRQLLKRWIAEGAQYEQHWAFIPSQRPPTPKVKSEDWPLNEIDRFILARLERESLEPSPQANHYTLVRRLYLDLIGLPPTPKEAEAFHKSALRNPQSAIENLVDRLFKSKQYGERWARLWLDLARYSDTNGYEKDRPRTMWPYRDWVIKALNDDMPFDQFTIEQLAGDMLPNATIDQRIATGFHRNTMLNEEGGIDPLEYRFYAMVDRVATTGTVWMGLTTGCAQCHSHKYDPISHTDYYSLMALLNNADEPDIVVPDVQVQQQRNDIEQQIAKLEQDLSNQFPPMDGDEPIAERRRWNLETNFDQWLAKQRSEAVAWTVLQPHRMKTNLPNLDLLKDGSIFSSGDITKRDVYRLAFKFDDVDSPITALRLEVLPDDRLPAGGPGRCYYEGRKGDFFLSEFAAKVDGQQLRFASASHSFGKISIGSGSADASNVMDGEGSTGWSTSGQEGKPHQLVLCFSAPLSANGELQIEMIFERHFAASLGRFRISAATSDEPKATNIPVELESLLTREADSYTDDEREKLLTYFLRVTPKLAESRKEIDQLRSRMLAFPAAMAMLERPDDNPRTTHRHHRGEYLSPKETVSPAIPALFMPLTTNPPDDRLSFAKWLVSNENPLAARVAVNRSWRAFFGAGLMRTSGDFGTQSDPPTHPKLLDWLAAEFVEEGWSMKKLHRLIVTSATYRQSSRVTPELLTRDPQNRLLARGPRYRVDAEMVRDIMLKSSGLLSSKMYGPSVYPPQPAIVTQLAYGSTKWNVSNGEDRYRRSLYTFNKRTAPFAAYTVFDGPTGEGCVARRNRSNTPLQALTLLNDEMFLEMARALGGEAAKLSSEEAKDRVAFIFQRFLTRPPDEHELLALLEYKQAQKQRFESSDLNPVKIVGDELATAELASLVMVARSVMNLDETITKQ